MMPQAARSLVAAFFDVNAAAFSTAVTSGSTRFVSDYLVTRCGLSPSAAKKASSRITGVKSPDKPDAVLAFLRSIGVGDSHFSRIFVWRPQVLLANVDKTLRPKIEELRVMGFSPSDIADIVVANPNVLSYNGVQLKLKFLLAILPDKPKLLDALRRDPYLLEYNFHNRVLRNFELLKERGVAESRINSAVFAMRRLLTQPTHQFKQFIDRVERLGFTPHSGMYLYAIRALSSNKGVLQDKIATMRDCGWSEAEFYSAFSRMPQFTHKSAETLRTKMRFLTEDAGLEPKQCAERPILLMYSLDKRLTPRLRVIRLLKTKGLFKGRMSMVDVFCLQEVIFRRRYLLPYLDGAPEIREICPA